MRWIIFSALYLACGSVWAEYVSLELKDVRKYHVCTSLPLGVVLNEGCDEKIIDNVVLSNDDRIQGKYIPYEKDENIFIITPRDNVEDVISIVQELPLTYTISTFENEFSGVFHNHGSYDWYVKCTTKKRNCIVSNRLVSIEVDADSSRLYKDYTNTTDNFSAQNLDKAISFAQWSISQMR